MHRVLIVGGGFGGLYAARRLRRPPASVTLVDRRNFHLFQPLLYQVATGGLSPANIAAPLRDVLKRQTNTRVLLGEVESFDAQGKVARLRDGLSLAYDTLIVAAGAGHHYFGKPEWEPLAPGLKTVEDATEIRRRVLLAFEAAERASDAAARAPWLTFVVVGAGPTGVELAGALAEIARYTLDRNFRNFDPKSARVLLVEGGERVLSSYADPLPARALRSLERIGVTVLTGAKVTAVDEAGVELLRGGASERIAARVVLWAAGVAASPLGKALQSATGCALDKAGRVIVEPDLTVPGHPEVLVIGDLAHCLDPAGKPLPGVAPVAMQQGRYAARLIQARLSGGRLPPFRYHDKGSMATIGRAAAVADLGFVRFGGYPAWLAWLFIHLMYIVEFDNRLLVFVQWAWSYLTRNRSARLITHARWPS